jgi:hypothetical protein
MEVKIELEQINMDGIAIKLQSFEMKVKTEENKTHSETT